MQQSLTLNGIWFLPNRKENAVSGILTFSPSEGIELDLIGSLIEGAAINHNHDPAIILGNTADGKLITLYKCYKTNSSISSNGFGSCVYDALYLFIGTQIETVEDLMFCQIDAELSDFDLWLEVYGFKKIEHDLDKGAMLLEYQEPKKITFNLSTEFDCAFKFSLNAPISPSISEAIIRQNCVVSIKPKDGLQHFDKLLACHLEMLRFMTLAYFELPVLLEIMVGSIRKYDGEKTYVHDTTVHFATRSNYNGERKKRSSRQYLFTYHLIKDNFQHIVNKWFYLGGMVSPSLFALSEAYSRSDQPLEFRFLNLAHAIESFHRRTLKSTEMSSESYQIKMERILSSVDSEFKDWVKGKLHFANEVTLHRRLEQLIQMIPSEIKKVLLKPSEEEFIRNFKNCRNYYTHYDPLLEKKALKDNDLLIFSERLKIFFTCIILKAMEFSDEQIRYAIFNNGVMLFNHIVPYQEIREYFDSLKSNG